MKPRVVLDTNVVVSALIFEGGRLVWLRHDWAARRFVPLASKETVDELLRVLAYPKFGLADHEIEALLGDYLPFVEPVHARPAAPVAEPADPDDRIFLELARVGRAAYLVTGDAGLLELPEMDDCRIISPAEFKTVLEQLHRRPAAGPEGARR